jgi:hypothetical protein
MDTISTDNLPSVSSPTQGVVDTAGSDVIDGTVLLSPPKMLCQVLVFQLAVFRNSLLIQGTLPPTGMTIHG